MEQKLPLPLFTLETAKQKNQMAEDAWNSKIPKRYHWLIQLTVSGETRAVYQCSGRNWITPVPIP
ncbi:DUF1348 family protein [Sphingobacterium chuzhouense]|uniref:DUF1348 family protein n=1 Tax=Sphingobacterium chuzhouense TaxID=1742264 RepID=UPI001CC21BE0|nr:DUF1348 family protein [Sphingobacterium chuzhouense]